MVRTVCGIGLGVALVSGVVASGQPIQEPQFKWLPGIDVMVRTYEGMQADKTTPGPLVNAFGYDRDTHTASVLRMKDQCHMDWTVLPHERYGAVVNVVQFGVGYFALLHETGYFTVVTEPFPPPPCIAVLVG